LPYSNRLDLEEQSSETVVYKFQQASSQLKQLSYLNARSVFQEYLIVPTAPVTVPAVTEPVLVPKQEASVLVGSS
jgi:hypothetical protein